MNGFEKKDPEVFGFVQNGGYLKWIQMAILWGTRR